MSPNFQRIFRRVSDINLAVLKQLIKPDTYYIADRIFWPDWPLKLDCPICPAKHIVVTDFKLIQETSAQ